MAAIQNLLEALFQLPSLVQFAIFALYAVAIGALAFGFLMVLRRCQAKPSEWIPVAPFSTSITTLFALFLAFHASTIWANKARAERAHITANMAMKRLDIALSEQQLNLPDIRHKLHRYVYYVSKDEWRHARNRMVSERATEAFWEVNGMVLAAAKTLPSPDIAQLEYLLNEVAQSRSEKLWIGANHTESSSWLIVFALGVLANFAIASVHFDKPKAGLVALTLFAAATTVAYASLGMVDDPYRFLDNLDPATNLVPTD
jgi:hypothetical protein